MGVWRVKSPAILEAVFDGNVVPAENLERIQVVDNRKCVKFVKARDDATIFDIGQAGLM